MKAVVLCAGVGSRLGALTNELPKPLLDVGGVPLLGRILKNLARAGVVDVGINVHHHGRAVSDFVGDGTRFGVRVRCVEEKRLSGTAGGAKRAAALFSPARDDPDEPLLVHYGDILTDHDLAALQLRHTVRAATATILVHRRAGSNSIVDVDADDRVVGFVERPMTTSMELTWVFSGIAVLSAAAVAALPDGGDIPRDVLIPMVHAHAALFAAPLTGSRYAIDSPARLAGANDAVVRGEYRGA